MALARPPLKALGTFAGDHMCLPCLRKLARSTLREGRHFSTTRVLRNTHAQSARGSASLFQGRYFVSNTLWDARTSKQSSQAALGSRTTATTTTASSVSAPTEHPTTHTPTHADPAIAAETELPHRRRRRRKDEDSLTEFPIPHDASAQLSNLSSTLPVRSLRQRMLTYLALTKPRLTVLMVIATTSAYALYPVAVTPFSTALDLSPYTLLNLTTGTALSAACANTLNMILEPEHDAKMSRTRARPLVRGLLTRRAALIFAIACGVSGVALLDYGVNPTVAGLSAFNIFLYAGVYTPMKRMHTVNTWVGALVGGIPPLMGWAAAAGQYQAALLPVLSSPSSPDPASPGWRDLLFDPATCTGGWLLAALLFAWQFPHFHAIAHTMRHEYANAGYKMLASVNTAKCGRVAIRYAALMVPICVGLSASGVTEWSFAATSTVVNVWLLRESWRFWRLGGAAGSARALFWASVWQLPLVLVLAMVQKRGVWDRVVRGGLGEEELEELAAEPDMDEEHATASR